MINLLSPQNKEILKQEKIWKILMILSIDLLLSLVCFILILVIFYFFILGEIISEKIIYEQREKEISVLKMHELEQNLAAFNEIFSSLDNFYQNRFKASETLVQITKVIPPEIYLTNISINPKKDTKKTIECVISGFAPQRESLLNLKENLEKQANFKEIYFPPADWVKSTDINFTVNFKILWP
jgi:Tfp pilus assembly protein PilN